MVIDTSLCIKYLKCKVNQHKANVLFNEVLISTNGCTLPTVSCVAQNNDCRTHQDMIK